MLGLRAGGGTVKSRGGDHDRRDALYCAKTQLLSFSHALNDQCRADSIQNGAESEGKCRRHGKQCDCQSPVEKCFQDAWDEEQAQGGNLNFARRLSAVEISADIGQSLMNLKAPVSCRFGLVNA